MFFPRTEADARAALEAISGIVWRPFGREHLPAIADFYAECESYDHNPERKSLAGLQEYWDSPRSRPEEDTLVGIDSSGQVVATAWAGCNRAVTERRSVHLGGAVRPDRRGNGIGAAVLRWQMAHGIAWDFATRREDHGPLVMRLLAPAGQSDLRDLAAGAVVGAALNCAFEQDWAATGSREGYTDELAVARTHRGRGIASALLLESMRRFAASGMAAAALAVDTANPSGALRLYESLGYQQTARTCIHQYVL